MEHEADAAGSPKADTREARAFSARDLLDPECPASRAAWAKLAGGEDFHGELRLRRGDGGDGERVALPVGAFEIEGRPGTTVKVEVHPRGDFGGGDGGEDG